MLRYSTFNFLRLSSSKMLRSSSVWGRHYLKDLQNIFWSFKLKFKIWVWPKKWLIRYSTFNFLRLSSIQMLRSSSVRDRHYLKDLQNIVWSFNLKFKIWVWSNKWLLRYSTFNFLRLSSIKMLRSSSIGGRLHLKHFWFWFGPLSLGLKFEENPISGCWKKLDPKKSSR